MMNIESTSFLCIESRTYMYHQLSQYESIWLNSEERFFPQVKYLWFALCPGICTAFIRKMNWCNKFLKLIESILARESIICAALNVENLTQLSVCSVSKLVCSKTTTTTRERSCLSKFVISLACYMLVSNISGSFLRLLCFWTILYLTVQISVLC